ncbi:MAG TPA: DUF6339 family protein [Ktedonobacteraceae bacterium]|nr:DUF6339 family protein [Ktedonobacteraceae bacterium]
MYLLYPRLPLPIAEALSVERASMNVEELVRCSSTSHEASQFAPTGGNKIRPDELNALQQQVRECAGRHGYPNAVSDEESKQFDIQCSIFLHQNMYLHPSEASHLDMWAFMGCVLLPDVVRWRFFSERTTRERFIGEDRGLRRHAFGRLWWRAYLLHQPTWNKPHVYNLLTSLNEDDLVQITERSSIAANPRLAVAFSLAFLRAIGQHGSIPRRQLMREASKRLFRLLSMISFESLDEDVLRTQMDQIFLNTAEALASLKQAEALVNTKQ